MEGIFVLRARNQMQTNFDHSATRATLLRRRGLVFVVPASERLPEDVLRAFDLELRALGFAMTHALRAQIATIPAQDARVLHRWLTSELAASIGADRTHSPLFRKFPDGIPRDTEKLWVQRFLVHLLQGEDQPCIHCGQDGTVHVLSPCHHVVCSLCFDGSNYGGCPICGHKVDDSPFLQPTPTRKMQHETRPLKLLHLGTDLPDAARRYFQQICARPQALSPDDREDLITLLLEFGEEVLDWVGDEIPLRENIAQIYGTLFTICDPALVLDRAGNFMTTATDVLRFIAAYSGADPSLQRTLRYKVVSVEQAPPAFLRKMAEFFGGSLPPTYQKAYLPQKVARFPVAKLSRAQRRALLGLLDSFPRESLWEDMLRHRAFWVWIGEFLHPGEYAKRYPNAALGFDLVRGNSVAGTDAEGFQSFDAHVEAALRNQDIVSLTKTLRQRPGVFGRRLDHALRLAQTSDQSDLVIDEFEQCIEQLATPMLLTLWAHFPKRVDWAPIRVFWPKGGTAVPPSQRDTRAKLRKEVVERVASVCRDELLRRFAQLSTADFVIDDALRSHMVPFNERTAASSAVSLSRGSAIDVPPSKSVRLFLHWCEPPHGWTTDLDLSVAFYDSQWDYAGVCSYYQLSYEDVARSSGDFTSAPFPDGASEFVDIDVAAARKRGVRYAVMVVNAYSGLPFDRLERAFAGLMLRDNVDGVVFDPRTVELKFALSGANGVFLPLVLDLEQSRLHWLDVHSQGDLAFNNVESSRAAIQRLCPNTMTYFAHGSRATIFDLATFHAAARGGATYRRDGSTLRRFARDESESIAQYFARLRAGEGGEAVGEVRFEQDSTVALLECGDIALPSGADIAAIFRQDLSPNLSWTDLLSG